MIETCNGLFVNFMKNDESLTDKLLKMEVK